MVSVCFKQFAEDSIGLSCEFTIPYVHFSPCIDNIHDKDKKISPTNNMILSADMATYHIGIFWIVHWSGMARQHRAYRRLGAKGSYLPL